MGLVCLNSLPGIGETCSQGAPLTIKSGMFLTRPDFSLSYANFMTEANWLTEIAAGNIFPVQNLIEEESQNFEDAVDETSTGRKIKRFEGVRGRMFKLSLSLEQHRNLRQYSGGNWRVFYIDYNNNIIGMSDDDATMKGFRLSYFNVNKYDDLTGTSSIVLQEKIPIELDTHGAYANPTWLASDLQGVLTVVATSSAVAANSITLTVAYVESSVITGAGTKKSTPVSGLLAANFKILNGSTEVTAGKVLTETAVLGTYTLTATTLVAGYTVQVIPSSTALYRSNTVTLAA